jgi:threonine dehydrogenase-like Zn-dependent dehydrogenase
MKAVCWMGKKKIEVLRVEDPRTLNPRDCIVRVTSTAICGSDLHLFNGHAPGMEKGDILGHEFMGEVVEVGPGVKKLRVGDRVVVPSAIACGDCFHCRRSEWSCCDNTNPNASLLKATNGHAGSAIFGWSHLHGGYAGGQAEYVRVPFADVGPLKIEDDLPDQMVLFLSDLFPTGYMAAENCAITPGRSVVAVWGCGPVGQFAIRSALLLGAAKVVAIDNVPERLRMAEAGGAHTINHDEVDDVVDRLHAFTGGRGPDAAIDAVGMDSHDSAYGRVKQTLSLENDPAHVLRQAMRAVRKGGVLSVPGNYFGLVDKLPLGAVFAKGVTIRQGPTHVHRYLRPLLELVRRGKIDPSFVITHRLPLGHAPQAYAAFAEKSEGCIKVVLDPSL